ncbi:MAG TPA: GAF domain-containing protein [Prolixibacteraceae bacterium]|nr:GAF domain-containing protein [Prolixibacteraceae bacterium]
MEKQTRYTRIYNQLSELFVKTKNPVARMATVCALLHHKMPGFFWTGYYLLDQGELIVGPYQGPVACLHLKKDTGVCWAGINQQKPVVVADVHCFEGHIACNPKSKSEIVVPLCNTVGEIVGVLDIDSDRFKQFDNVDAEKLMKINGLIFK